MTFVLNPDNTAKLSYSDGHAQLESTEGTYIVSGNKVFYFRVSGGNNAGIYENGKLVGSKDYTNTSEVFTIIDSNTLELDNLYFLNYDYKNLPVLNKQ